MGKKDRTYAFGQHQINQRERDSLHKRGVNRREKAQHAQSLMQNKNHQKRRQRPEACPKEAD